MQVGVSLEARLQAAWRLWLGPELSAFPEFCPAWTGCFISMAYVTMSIGIFVIRKVFKLYSKQGAPDKTKQRHLACVLLVKIPSQQQYRVS